jgi:hypothetical protein
LGFYDGGLAVSVWFIDEGFLEVFHPGSLMFWFIYDEPYR